MDDGEESQSVLSGDDGLIPDCIPFSSIPHTTKLFSDYLSYAPSLRPFYPQAPEAGLVVARAALVPAGTRIHQQVADALERQNRAFGAGEKTLANIQRLREGAHAVVTGQQVGLFGGPLLSLLKAASVLALAKQVESAGVACVPVFWMATEDHDLAEVNQTLLLTNDYQLESFSAESVGQPDSPVANVRFGARTEELISRAATVLGHSDASALLQESYREGETFSGAFAKLYTRLFGEHGLILLDPADEELHRWRRRCLLRRSSGLKNWMRRCWPAIARSRRRAITSR